VFVWCLRVYANSCVFMRVLAYPCVLEWYNVCLRITACCVRALRSLRLRFRVFHRKEVNTLFIVSTIC